jgi:cell wall assembly regulator SMI1
MLSAVSREMVMDQQDASKRLLELFSRVLGTPGTPPPMTELVRRLDAWLSEHRPEYYAHLLPGLTDSEWVAFEDSIGVMPPDSFRVLYQWRNGQQDDQSFRGNQYWMSSAEVTSSKELMDSMIGYDFEPGWWDRNWIPFLHNGGGSHLCVDVVGIDSGTAGQLVEFWNRDADRPVVAPSLEHWLYGFVRSLERDRWEETRTGFECVEHREEQNE